MLIRDVAEGSLCIPQPAHAVISGRFAEVWELDPVTPDLILAATLHDIAWTEWEQQPALNPETGLPQTFRQIPTTDHLDLWEGATARAATFGIYPALLASKHFTYLYDRFHNFEADPPEVAKRARALVTHELQKQEKLAAQWRAVAGDAAAERILPDQQMVALWDLLSLAVCHGIEEPTPVGQLTVKPVAPGVLTITPWPFMVDVLELHIDGKLLAMPASSQEDLDRALAAAPVMRVTEKLIRNP